MTDKQPEALRLADGLEKIYGLKAAAIEMRRLHEVNAELVESIANLIKVKGRHNTEIAYQKLVSAYGKATGEQ